MVFLLLHLITRIVLTIGAHTANSGSVLPDRSEDDDEDDEGPESHSDDEEVVDEPVDVCLCDPPDPQIPCEMFRGEPLEVSTTLDPELGIPRHRVALLKDFLLHPDRGLTGPHGLNLLPHVPLVKLDIVNSLLRLFTLDQVVRHLGKTSPASLPSHVRESIGWCRELLKSQRYDNILQLRAHNKKEHVVITFENLWFAFLTIVKASQSGYPPMPKQEGALSVKNRVSF